MSHLDDAIAYAEDVVEGRKSACKEVVQACQRFNADLERDFEYVLNARKANRVCNFIEKLRHIKGKWSGKRIKLEPWQKFILCNVFGWVHKETGLRRFRTAYIEVPRKNAKSTLSSGVGLYMLSADEEGGAECYSAATTRDQARIVFRDAQQMARKSSAFREKFGVAVNAHNINVLKTASKFEALSADSNSLDGLNVHLGAIDELHAHKTREVFDVIETATGARTQSLVWLITTAGSNRAGICYEQRTYVNKILSGAHRDDTYFGIIYTVDDGDDWTDPVTWEKANPNYGVSVFPDDVARLCLKAQQMPSAQNNFLTKRLNVWVNADTAWMDMRKWDGCGEEIDMEDFAGQKCIIGVDLASKTDIAAKISVFEKIIDEEKHYYVFGRYYLPETAVEDGRNSQYSGWEREGRLISTPGEVTDLSRIEQDIKADASDFEVEEVAYDPFQATQLSLNLERDGFEVVEVRPTVLNFSEPMKELEALVLQRRLHHDGCPVLSWMVSNVVCHLDNKDNIYPKKERPENKIDGVVGLIMALARYLVREEEGPSVYESRGVRAF